MQRRNRKYINLEHISNSVHLQCIHGRVANHPYLQLVVELRRTQINMAAAFKAQERSTTITLYSQLSQTQEQSPNPVQLSLTLDCSSERAHATNASNNYISKTVQY